MLQSILDAVPWFGPAIVWLVAVVLVWLLASIPAYFLSRLTQLAVALIRDFVERCRERFAASHRSSREQLSTQRANVVKSLSHRRLDTAAHEQWLLDARALGKPLDAATAEFSKASQKNDVALAVATSVRDNLSRLKPDAFTVPVVARAEELASQHIAQSGAWLNLLVGITLLAPIVVVNAQLTNLVLREALPDIQGTFASLPPSYALAIVVTLAEAGIGVVHGAISEDARATDRQYTIGWLVLSMLACVVIFAETLFYAQFRESGGSPFTIPGFGVSVPPGTAFGLIGLILGSSVFALGRLSYVSARAVLRNRSLRGLRRHFDALRRAAIAVQDVSESRAKQWGSAAAFFENFQSQLESRRLLLRIDEAVDKAEAFTQRSPGWAAPTDRQLTPADVSSLESRALISCLVFVVAAVASFAAWGAVAADLFPRMATPGHLAVAAAVEAALVASGLWWGSRTYASANARMQFSTAATLMIAAMGVAIGGLLAAAVSSTSLAGAAVLAILATAALFASGVFLSDLLPFVVLLLKSVGLHFKRVLLLLLVGILYLWWLAVAIVDWLVAIVVEPTNLFVSLFSRRVAAP